MIEYLGGRKFIIGLLVMGVGIAIDLIFSKGLSDNVMQLLIYVAGGFFLGNSAVTVASILKGGSSITLKGDSDESGAPPVVVNTDELKTQVNDIKAQQGLIMEALSAQTNALHTIMVAAKLIPPTKQ